MNIYDFKVKKMNGDEIELSVYKGDVLLIVNTATECGFTPQYENLQSMYENFHDNGFVILDFPCDQFGHQAPGSNEQIAKFCTARFGVNFPQLAKIEVNGVNQSPLFAFLKKQQKFNGFDLSSEAGNFMHKHLSKIDPDYAKNDDIKWNFTKFLINRKGDVVARFEPSEDMSVVNDAVLKLL